MEKFVVTNTTEGFDDPEFTPRHEPSSARTNPPPQSTSYSVSHTKSFLENNTHDNCQAPQSSGYSDKSSGFSDQPSGFGNKPSGFNDAPSGFNDKPAPVSAGFDDSFFGSSTPDAAAAAAAPVPAVLAGGRRVRALFDFEGQQDDELSFREGDIIKLISEGEDGWWRAELNGKQGMLPFNYVEAAP